MRFLLFLIFIFLAVSANARFCADFLRPGTPAVWPLTRALLDRLSKENSWQETLWSMRANQDPRATLLENYIQKTFESDNYLILRPNGGASDTELVQFPNGMMAIRKMDVLRHNHVRGSVASYIIDRHAGHPSRFPVTVLRNESGHDLSLQLFIPGLTKIRRQLTRLELSKIFLADLINDELDRFREDYEEQIFNLQQTPSGAFVAFDGGQSHYGPHLYHVLSPEKYHDNPLAWSFRLRRCCAEDKKELILSLEKEITYLIHQFGNKFPDSLVAYEKINEAKLREDLKNVLSPTEIDRVFIRIQHFSQILRQIYRVPKTEP